jgi:hypothetical protein
MFSGGCMARFWCSWYAVPKNPEQLMLDIAVQAMGKLDDDMSEAKRRSMARLMFADLRAANFSVGLVPGYRLGDNSSLSDVDQILEIQRWVSERPRKSDGAEVISAVVEAPDNEIIIQAIVSRGGEPRFVTMRDDDWMPNSEVFSDKFSVSEIVNGAAAEH